jgi:hypothetical protein
MKDISEYCCKTFDPLIVNASINYIQRLLILTNFFFIEYYSISVEYDLNRN